MSEQADAMADVLAGFVDVTDGGPLPPAAFVDAVLEDLNTRHGRTDDRYPDPDPAP